MDLELLQKAKDIANHIQESDIQSFILKNQNKIEPDLLRFTADQWIARQKSKYKLPTWYANKDIIFPPPLSVEQSSSDITANYKAEIFCQNNKANLIDLTGGMGVDTSAFAKRCKSVIYVEQKELLAKVARHNFDVLGFKNIEVINNDSNKIIKKLNSSITHWYIDPARRDNSNNKVFKIEDCEPNIIEIKHLFKNYLVKFSPLLDIKLAIEQLKDVSEVYIIAVENEVKELLFLNRDFNNSTQIICVNFLSNGNKQSFHFDYSKEQNAFVNYSDPQMYIYEPNAAILKAGAFKSIAQTLQLNKLAPNSHLYTSSILVENFPGRSFVCEAVCKFDKKEILSKLPTNQANITTRNFPIKPDEIKKKLGLKDGGDSYLFATENYERQKIVLVCRKTLNE